MMGSVFETLHSDSNLEKARAVGSKLAATVAIVCMAMAIMLSQVSLANAKDDRHRILAEVSSLKEELKSVKEHCEMDRNMLREQIELLKRQHR